MTAVSHRVGAMAATATFIYVTGLSPIKAPVAAACYIIGAMAGSIFPDADMPYSRMGRRYLIVLWPFYLLQFFIHLIAPRSFADYTFRHRGVFHFPVTWSVILGGLLYWTNSLEWRIPYCLSIGFGIGVISHLFLDFFSGGIPLLGPFYPKKMKPIVRIRTGSLMEQLVCMLMLLYGAFVCWRCFVI